MNPTLSKLINVKNSSENTKRILFYDSPLLCGSVYLFAYTRGVCSIYSLTGTWDLQCNTDSERLSRERSLGRITSH